MLKSVLGAWLLVLCCGATANAGDKPRIVVLKWSSSDLGYDDGDLQRIVKSRIGRSDAVFAPSVDLFQNGRKHPNRNLGPIAQPGKVGAEHLTAVKKEVNRVKQIRYNRLNESGWAQEAEILRRFVDQVWFVETAEQREALFLLYGQIGRAAWFQGSESPPFFESIGGTTVNYYHYLAATMAKEDPGLMDLLQDEELTAYIGQYLDLLNAGEFPTMPLDFELENRFDLDEFGKRYQIFLNGLEVTPNKNGQILVPLGRTDISLKTTDGGYGLSERLVVDKLEDKAFFVRDVARKSMGIDFIDKLMEHPNECSPELESRMHLYLSIYAKMHAEDEIYIVVPQEGKLSKLRIWRFDRRSSSLQLVGGGANSFPVRFSVVAASGSMFNTASVAFAPDFTGGDYNTSDKLDDIGKASLGGEHIPVNFELRLHYNRWMVAFGTELGIYLGDEGAWVERYPGTDGLDLTVKDESGNEIFESSAFNQLPYVSVGMLLGKEAGIGLGPRAAVRFGRANLPRANVVTLHGGYSHLMPGVEADGRVRPFVDADFRVGMILPLNGSLQYDLAPDLESGESLAQPTFGLTAGVGTTF